MLEQRIVQERLTMKKYACGMPHHFSQLCCHIVKATALNYKMILVFILRNRNQHTILDKYKQCCVKYPSLHILVFNLIKNSLIFCLQMSSLILLHFVHYIQSKKYLLSIQAEMLSGRQNMKQNFPDAQIFLY